MSPGLRCASVVSRFAFALALASLFTPFLASPASASTGSPVAVYDPLTGSVSFQGLTGHLGVRLDSRDGNLLSEATDLGGALTGELSVINQAMAPGLIEWGNLAGIYADDAFAGNVVVPGTSVEDLWFQYALPDASIHNGTILWKDPASGDLLHFASQPLETWRSIPPPPAPAPDPIPAPDPTPPPTPIPPAPVDLTTAPPDLPPPVAIYDPLVGTVSFQGLTGHLGLRLDSRDGNLLAQATDLDGALAGSLSVVNQSQAPGFLEWGDLTGIHAAEAFAGAIVAPGTSVEDLWFQYALPDASVHSGAILWKDHASGELLSFDSQPLETWSPPPPPAPLPAPAPEQPPGAEPAPTPEPPAEPGPPAADEPPQPESPVPAPEIPIVEIPVVEIPVLELTLDPDFEYKLLPPGYELVSTWRGDPKGWTTFELLPTHNLVEYTLLHGDAIPVLQTTRFYAEDGISGGRLFAANLPTDSAGESPIPEPSAVTLATLGLLILHCRGSCSRSIKVRGLMPLLKNTDDASINLN